MVPEGRACIGLPFWACVRVTKVGGTGKTILRTPVCEVGAITFMPLGDPRVEAVPRRPRYPNLPNLTLSQRVLQLGESVEERVLVTEDVRLAGEGRVRMGFLLRVRKDREPGVFDPPEEEFHRGEFVLDSVRPSPEEEEEALEAIRRRLDGDLEEAVDAAWELWTVAGIDRIRELKWLCESGWGPVRLVGLDALSHLDGEPAESLLRKSLEDLEDRVVDKVLLLMGEMGALLTKEEGERILGSKREWVKLSLVNYLVTVRHPHGREWLEALARDEVGEVRQEARKAMEDYRGE